jgi:protein-tyrosine phosphatase
MNHILTLCVGNICRSPTAEALLKQHFPQKTVWSAGLSALVGNSADPFSIEVAAAHGVDLSAHRAQQVSQWMCQTVDLILVMEQSHKTALEQHFPMIRGKVFRLGEPKNFDIVDPYKKTREAFEAAYTDIARGVAAWVPRIRQLD